MTLTKNVSLLMCLIIIISILYSSFTINIKLNKFISINNIKKCFGHNKEGISIYRYNILIFKVYLSLLVLLLSSILGYILYKLTEYKTDISKFIIQSKKLFFLIVTLIILSLSLGYFILLWNESYFKFKNDIEKDKYKIIRSLDNSTIDTNIVKSKIDIYYIKLLEKSEKTMSTIRNLNKLKTIIDIIILYLVILLLYEILKPNKTL